MVENLELIKIILGCCFVFLFVAICFREKSIVKKKAALNLPLYKIIYTDQKETNKSPNITYGKILCSEKYNIQGKPDYIFKHRGRNKMVPVEIKSGTIGEDNMPHQGDLMQLVAYFIIVKEVYNVKPKFGYVIYKDYMFKVKNSSALRKELIHTLDSMRGMLRGKKATPNASFVTCRYCVCNGTVCDHCESNIKKRVK